ncbi:hypothetical protein BJY04DRAFT_175487 [Aspergillus karnatakaensis]|uniref:uncharacterized protein n=1 Tax=Aspergillus karnatakaensis TaxID=1810916 RepID=UPI003CCCA67F
MQVRMNGWDSKADLGLRSGEIKLKQAGPKRVRLISLYCRAIIYLFVVDVLGGVHIKVADYSWSQIYRAL